MPRSSKRAAKLPAPSITRAACLEFRAVSLLRKEVRNGPTIIVYCASGGRSALAGKVLKDMGYSQVFNMGAFKDWAESGGHVDKPIDMGMS
jgi:rhodanese-related sulfurtransferase